MFIFDQYLKFLFRRLLLPGQSIPIIKGIFHFTLVENTGIAFGLFRDKFSIFLLVLIIFSIFYFLFISRKKNFFGGRRIWILLIFAGAISNLVDRIRFGFVIDYLDFRIWPVFNLADCAITMGIILLIWESFKNQTRRFKRCIL